MKTFKLTVTEDELKALIDYHRYAIGSIYTYSNDKSYRIHDLTKSLNKTETEIELKTDGANEQIEAAKEEIKLPQG